MNQTKNIDDNSNMSLAGIVLLKFFQNKEHAENFVKGKLLLSMPERLRKFGDKVRGDVNEATVKLEVQHVIELKIFDEEGSEVGHGRLNALSIRNDEDFCCIFSVARLDKEGLTRVSKDSWKFDDYILRCIQEFDGPNGFCVIFPLKSIVENIEKFVETKGSAVYGPVRYVEKEYNLNEAFESEIWARTITPNSYFFEKAQNMIGDMNTVLFLALMKDLYPSQMKMELFSAIRTNSRCAYTR